MKFNSIITLSVGVLGSFIGLVLMFQSLDEPSTIGIKISVAMITFLYAVIIFTANSIVAQKIVKELMNREK